MSFKFSINPDSIGGEICDGHVDRATSYNFTSLCLAAEWGELGVMKAVRKRDNQEVFVIVSYNEEDKELVLLAELVGTDLGSAYDLPEGVKLKKGAVWM
jgi:hypothetical protein